MAPFGLVLAPSLEHRTPARERERREGGIDSLQH